MHTVTKIISGGQTGADQGGLAAGFMLGIKTGGTAPPKFKTEDGLKPELLKSYGLVEGEYDPRVYPKRTRKNVADSDGTVLFGDVISPGTKLTIRCCIELKKPYIANPDHELLRDWVTRRNIHTLNVAGNREWRNPGIFDTTMETIVKALTKKEKEVEQ